jgi:cytoskeleton protein RodZ
VLHERKSRLAGGRANMSIVTAERGVVAAAPRVGADLCAARERLGWSLDAVSAGLRIRLSFLVALEQGRIADLPGNAYAIGFLRTYAATLGLDPDELTRRFRSEAAEVNRLTELSFPAPVPSRGVPAGAVVLLGAVLAVGAYIGWYRLSGNGALPPEVVPPVPARLAPLAERAVPPASVTPNSTMSAANSPTSGSVMTGRLASGPSAAGPPATGLSARRPSETGLSASGTPAASSLASATPAALPPGPAGITGPAGVPAPLGPTDSAAAPEPAPYVPPSQAAAATTAPTAPHPADQPRVVLSATADAWMQVRDKSGQVLLNRVLHPGEFWAVPAQPSLVLTTGNAGGTDILVDGATMPPLGASGAVRRDIPLDPDLLKTGKIPSAALPMTTASSAGSSMGSSGASSASPMVPAIAPRSASQ